MRGVHCEPMRPQAQHLALAKRALVRAVASYASPQDSDLRSAGSEHHDHGPLPDGGEMLQGYQVAGERPIGTVRGRADPVASRIREHQRRDCPPHKSQAFFALSLSVPQTPPRFKTSLLSHATDLTTSASLWLGAVVTRRLSLSKRPHPQ